VPAMSGRIAGSNRPPREVLTVDYADVLRQAVENERHNVIREVLRRVNAVRTTVPSTTRSYHTDDRRGDDVKTDIIAAIERLANKAGRGES
jgi:hypothetical protein